MTDPIKHTKSKVVEHLKTRKFYKDVFDREQVLSKKFEDNKDVLDYFWFAKPGHFYSPLLEEKPSNIKDMVNLKNPDREEAVIPGIKLNKPAQLNLLTDISKHLKQMPDFTKKDTNRYYFGNDQFGKADGTLLYLMLRHLKPKQIIEVGSGWTSAMMLDVNEKFPKDAAKLTFIEPYPERLYSTLRPGDKKHCKIVDKAVQSVEPTDFTKLNEGDLLFIDCSHVSKSGSDVNYLLFEVLPRLKKGVVVHIHDIFYPFEYPSYWLVDEKRNWNEAYTVRALLIGGELFEIILWHSYLVATDKDKVEKTVPGILELGASLWLRKK